MSARLPLLHKTPFVLDERPLYEATSPHAGLLSVSRVYRALGMPALVGANLALRKRQRGFAEAQFIESISLLQTVGGECPEDMHLLAGDDCLARGLGYGPPKATAVREFLERFHDQKLETLRPKREVQKSFIFPSSQPVSALQAVLSGQVRRIARLYEKQGQPQRIATVDQDATIIESHKQQALPTYEGTRGYQPMLAAWAETGLVLADQFRDGNVPAQMEPREVAQRAFAALPGTVGEYYYRGDAACHESGLVNGLRDEQRAGGPRGRIGFAISARMSEPLHTAIGVVPESAWQPYGDPHPAEIRECADVPFVPGEKTEKKDVPPLRYVAVRIRKKQDGLFDDGSALRHFAVLSNRWELKPARLIEWHREKAGTIELVHDVIKNDLGGGVLPSKYFGANAAWLRLAVIAHNVLVALKRLALPPELLTARPKRLRFLLFNMPGRLVHHARRLILRVAAVGKWTAAYGQGLRLLPVSP